MAVLLSMYSPEVLRSVLAHERVQALEIWSDFVRGYQRLDPISTSEQDFFDEYSQRFANILLSMQECTAITDAQRLEELRASARRRSGCAGMSQSRFVVESV